MHIAHFHTFSWTLPPFSEELPPLCVELYHYSHGLLLYNITVVILHQHGCSFLEAEIHCGLDRLRPHGNSIAIFHRLLLIRYSDAAECLAINGSRRKGRMNGVLDDVS